MNKVELKALIKECILEMAEETKEVDAICPRCKCNKAVTTERHGCKCLKCNHSWNPFDGASDSITESDASSITQPSPEKIESIKSEFPPRITKMLDFSLLKTSENDVIAYFRDNASNIIRTSVSVIDDESNAVLLAQLRKSNNNQALKVLAYGPVTVIDALIVKSKPLPSGQSISPKPYNPTTAQYGGNPEDRPWGLGT